MNFRRGDARYLFSICHAYDMEIPKPLIVSDLRLLPRRIASVGGGRSVHELRHIGTKFQRIKPRECLVSPAAIQITIGIDATVAEKRPDSPEFLQLMEIQTVMEDFLLIGRGLGDDLTVGICDE